jgi:hypothetical protein
LKKRESSEKGGLIMFGLPIGVAVVIIIAIVIAVLVAGLAVYKRRDISFTRFFRIGPKSGTEESVGSVVQATLEETAFDLQTEKGLMGYFSQRATEAPGREKRLQLHAETESARRQVLRQKSRLAQEVTVAAHFGHTDIVRQMGLAQYLPAKDAGR